MASESNPGFLSAFAYSRERAGLGPMTVGLLVLFPMLLAVSTWAYLAPLSSAAIAPGEIVLSSDRKAVQHLEGGLVTEIFVREGQSVKIGEPLIVVQDLAERSRIEALELQLLNTQALRARLMAEHEGRKTPNFDEVGTGLDVEVGSVQQFAKMHLGVFRHQIESISSAEELSESRKEQVEREVEGLKAQLGSKELEIALVREDLEKQQKLLKRGISTEVQVNALLRGEALLLGEIGALSATIAQRNQSMIDQDIEIFRLKNERASAVLQELQRAQLDAENARQELRTLQDRQARSIIRSPATGVVLGMQVHTLGAVVAPGMPLMEVVPNEDDLIIEAKVNPTDIDLVKPGGSAEVMLSAFKANKVDKLAATIDTISGDIVLDELTGEKYFLARLRVTEAAIAELPPSVELAPGMPADVFMIAGERTMADYLLSPILDSARRAFRED